MDLCEAAEAGDLGRVVALLDGGAEVDGIDRYGWTALMNAAEQGSLAVVQALVERGADVNARDADEGVALIKAARHGHLDVVQWLLDHGADVHAHDLNCETALIAAAGQGQLAVVEALLDRGASIDDRTDFDCTALMVAAWRGAFAVVQLLLERGSSVDARNLTGATALIEAATYGKCDAVQWLLDHGAAIDARDRYHRSALFYAARGGHQAVVQQLLERGADVHGADRHGWTAMLSAADRGYLAMASLLREHGAAWPDLSRLFGEPRWRTVVFAIVEIGYCPALGFRQLNASIGHLTTRQQTEYGYLLMSKHVERGLPRPDGVERHSVLEEMVDFFYSERAGLDAEGWRLLRGIPESHRLGCIHRAVMPLIQVGLAFPFCQQARVGCVASLRLGWLEALVERRSLPAVVADTHRALRRQARLVHRFFAMLLSTTGQELPSCADRLTSFFPLESSSINRLACVNLSMARFAREMPGRALEPSGDTLRAFCRLHR